MPSREILARNMKQLRTLHGLSQEALAHDAGIDRTYVSDLERGLYAASIDMLDALAQVFKINASDLIDDEYAP